MRYRVQFCLRGALFAAAVPLATLAPGAFAAEEEEKISIEDLVKRGWQIAGYTEHA